MSGPDWLTLQEASEATGVPAATIRKWARHQNVPTFLEQTEEGYLRYVSMTGIRHWAGEIGREIETREVDLAEEEAADDSPPPPEGSMLVPLDAWNRLLNQLGNLHEAGQQLAEARERAAKAETEARFLRERMAELREELEQARTSSSSTVRAPVEPVEPKPGLTGLARKAYTGWRRRRRA
jgi:DNA-binding transcriptional MerR regulator